MNPRVATRVVLALICVMGVVLTARSPVAAVSVSGQTVTNGAVEWKVLEESREIQVSVTMAFFVGDDDRTLDPSTVRRAVERIKAAITNVWDGQSFGCYRLKVMLTASIVSSIEDVGKGEIPVRLTSQLVVLGDSMQAYVMGRQQPQGPDDHISDSPATRFDPYDGEFYANNPSVRPTTFSMVLDDDAYAHEFGHVLGLDDGYERGSFGSVRRRQYAENDLMYQAGLPLSPVSVARAVRRSGLDVTKLKCHYRYFLPPSQIFPYTPGNNISIDLILCNMPLLTRDTDVLNATWFDQPFLGTISGGFDFAALGAASGGGRVSGTYNASLTYLDATKVVFFFRLGSDSLRQEAEWVGDVLAATSPPYLYESTLPILGPLPVFTPEPSAEGCP